MAVIGVVFTSAQVPAARQVDFLSPGGLAFVVVHLVFAAAGLWVMRRRPLAA